MKKPDTYIGSIENTEHEDYIFNDEKIISNQSLDDLIQKFKDLLNDQYKNAKDYKPKIAWFEGTWSAYKPEKGKDKRGVTGADTKKLLSISEKINSLPTNLNLHKIYKIYFNYNIILISF